MVGQNSLDIAARITPLEVDTKVANALLGGVTAAALASKLASRDASISGLQASKADAIDTSSEVDSKIAAALLGAVTTAALDAATGAADASRRAPRTPRSRPARPRSRAPSTQSSRSSPPCSFPAAAELLMPAWAGFTTWELVRGSIWGLLSTAALLAYYTLVQVDALLGDYRTGARGDDQRHHRRAAGLLEVSVDGYTLTLAVNPWNIVRAYNLTPAESSLPAATGLARPVVHMSEANNVYDRGSSVLVKDSFVCASALSLIALVRPTVPLQDRPWPAAAAPGLLEAALLLEICPPSSSRRDRPRSRRCWSR